MNGIIEKGISIIEDTTKQEILSKEILKDIPHVREFLDGKFGSYIVILVVAFIIYISITNVQYSIRKSALARKVTLKRTKNFYRTLCRFGISIQNHPKEWNELRSILYNVCKSPEIPTELKRKLKRKLEKKGLVADRVFVTDNYVSPAKKAEKAVKTEQTEKTKETKKTEKNEKTVKPEQTEKTEKNEQVVNTEKQEPHEAQSN